MIPVNELNGDALPPIPAPLKNPGAQHYIIFPARQHFHCSTLHPMMHGITHRHSAVRTESSHPGCQLHIIGM